MNPLRSLRMPRELEKRIEAEAKRDDRQFGPMLRVLAKEALEAREARTKR